MQSPTIDDLVRAYRRGGASRERVVEKMAELVYREPRRYGFDDEDAAADALFKYHGRLECLADRYEDRGVRFEAYLSSCLRYLARSVRRERRRSAERDLVCERALAPFCREQDLAAQARPWGEREEPAASLPGMRGKPPPVAAAFASRLVFLALKCAWEVDDELADRVARASGVDPAWFSSALTQARRSLETERCRYERMQERRNGSWCRLRLLESRIDSEGDATRKRLLLAAMERERGRLSRARAEMASFKPVVPNSVVARILGVPKGTVDSGLYYLKSRSRAAARAAPYPRRETERRGGARKAAGLAEKGRRLLSSADGNLRSHR